jgi:hypothetical protein
MARDSALHHLTLHIVGHAPTRSGDKAADFPIGLILRRLKNGVLLATA